MSLTIPKINSNFKEVIEKFINKNEYTDIKISMGNIIYKNNNIGENKNFILCSNGKFYSTPYYDKNFVEFDIEKKERKIINNLDVSENKIIFSGGVEASDGNIYFSPAYFNKIAELNPKTYEVKYYDILAEIPSIYGFSFEKPYFIGNNKIIFASSNSNATKPFLIFNIITKTLTYKYLNNIPFDCNTGYNSIFYNNKIYLFPYNGKYIVSYNIVTDSISYIKISNDNLRVSHNILGIDGIIYGVETTESYARIIEFNLTNATYKFYSTDVTGVDFSFHGPDGYIYFCNYNYILKFDHVNKKINKVAEMPLLVHTKEKAVLYPNGKVYIFSGKNIEELDLECGEVTMEHCQSIYIKN